MRRATGRERDEWFALLDARGVRDRPYREIAGWLAEEHGMGRWWAQKLAVEYQQARGSRLPGIRPDGTFTATASRALAAPPARVFAAFADPAVRERWLPGAEMHERTARPGRSARFDWGDGPERVHVSIDPRPGGSSAALEHARLPDPAAAERAKAFWRERLGALAALLEDETP